MLLDNGEADEQQSHSESLFQSACQVAGISHPVMTAPSMQYAAPPQLGAGITMVSLWNKIICSLLNFGSVKF